MMPLLVIFQIPAAAHIARVGYKKFVYAGWGTRVMFIFGIALVPLTGGFLSPPTQLALILFLLFGFNLSRGISSAAWLPWITTLVPLEIRGKYLAREAACVHVASCTAMSRYEWSSMPSLSISPCTSRVPRLGLSCASSSIFSDRRRSSSKFRT